MIYLGELMYSSVQVLRNIRETRTERLARGKEKEEAHQLMVGKNERDEQKTIGLVDGRGEGREARGKALNSRTRRASPDLSTVLTTWTSGYAW
jgi:hypothetical protein